VPCQIGKKRAVAKPRGTVGTKKAGAVGTESGGEDQRTRRGPENGLGESDKDQERRNVLQFEKTGALDVKGEAAA